MLMSRTRSLWSQSRPTLEAGRPRRAGQRHPALKRDSPCFAVSGALLRQTQGARLPYGFAVSLFSVP
jgi:hypothetical protein